MKKAIYKGEFVGRDAAKGCGVVWRVEIWRVYDDGVLLPFQPGALTFDGDTPVEIAWSEKAKYDVLVGSTCTLRIISPGDRTYVDLYTIKAGDIGVTVWRDGQLYWTGTLDPEFYEEPYEAFDNYTVQLTFSDFGILDRLKYTAAGMRSIRDLLDEALERCRLYPDVDVDSSMMSLHRRGKKLEIAPGQSSSGRPIMIATTKYFAMGLADLYVRSDNFYDEDGEAATLKETLEGVLQPLGLRMEQRAARIYIYDLNGLYNSQASETVQWDGDSQTLGVDEVANNATVTWSPYADTGELLPDECWPEDIEIDATQTNIDNVDPKTVNGCEIFTYHLTQDEEMFTDHKPSSIDERVLDQTDAGFTLWLSKTGRNVELAPYGGGAVNNGFGMTKVPRVFRIVAQHDGTDCEGVALCWPGVKQYIMTYTKDVPIALKGKFVLNIRRGEVEAKGYGYCDRVYQGKEYCLARDLLAENGRDKMAFGPGPLPLFSTVQASLPPMADGYADLKVSMRMLMDVRFNPFESSVDFKGSHVSYQQKDSETRFKQHCNYVYVPVRIIYIAEGGENDGMSYVWTDMRIFDIKPGDQDYLTLESTMSGEWCSMAQVDDDDPNGYRQMSFLAYYSESDRLEQSGVLGWQDNRQCIHNTAARLQTALAKNGTGQYIPYPPKSIQGTMGGKILVQVMDSRWVIANDTWPVAEGVLSDPLATWGGTWNRVQWLLCELPQIEVVSTSELNRDIEDEDVEYSGEINPDAKDDISIDTICGTKKGGYPTARGAYFDSEGEQITELTRAGRTGQVEDLLIGTLYSQYATRHTSIEGEAVIATGGVRRWAERLQGETRFMLVSETQDLQAGTGDRKIVELSPDEYKRKD